MTALYVTALGEALGKTALCAGLARRLAAEGKKVGYLKPVALAEAEAGPDYQDGDAAFLREALGLEEPASALCPLALTRTALEAAAQDPKEALDKVKDAYSRVSRGKDVVLVEGLSGVTPGSAPGRLAAEMAQALQARVILLAGYSSGPLAQEVAAAAQPLMGRLAGVIVNFAPAGAVESLKASLGAVKLLGILPEDRRLLTLSVADLARCLEAQALNSVDGAQELVENVMLGVLTADPVLPYFQGRANKAVVVRSNRPDLQLAALETSTRCLVLTGDTPPLANITYRAQELGVPLLQVNQDTASVVEKLETALAQARFRQRKKLEVLDEILAQSLDWEALRQALT